MRSKKILFWVVLVLGGAALASAVPLLSYLDGLHHVETVVSTVPDANGDMSPRGVAIVFKSSGVLVRNNVLVSNFCNSEGLPGTGTTIVQVWPNGVRTLFAKLDPADYDITPQRIGLTGALAVLSNGWVIVGSLPTLDGTAATATDGDIFILNSYGKVVKILNGDMIHGPWGATVLDGGNHASLFITNVLEGTVAASPNIVNNGTVVRIDLTTPQDTGDNAPTEESRTIIGSGFPQRTDPTALVIGPTGLAVSLLRLGVSAEQFPFPAGVSLYVSNTLMDEIRVIEKADTRQLTAGTGNAAFRSGSLNQPLGLVMTPFFSLLATNGGDGRIVEFSILADKQVGSFTLNENGAGTLFDLDVPFGGPRVVPVPGIQAGASLSFSRQVYFVDDGKNSLQILK
jgi:hypothetical protein